MSLHPLPLLAALALAALLATGCSPAPESAPGSGSAAPDARVEQDLALYREMREKGSFELAAPIGDGVLQRAPDSAAAAEIRETIEEARARAHEINETRRLAALWLYQTGPMADGEQSTATIYPTRPAAASRRIRLILRRHTDWGESVYLYDTAEAGFHCKGSCRLPLKVDGEPARALRASVPSTGEPALFIDSDKQLHELLRSAGKLQITVDLKGGEPQELLYEVSGFDPGQWLPVEKAARG